MQNLIAQIIFVFTSLMAGNFSQAFHYAPTISDVGIDPQNIASDFSQSASENIMRARKATSTDIGPKIYSQKELLNMAGPLPTTLPLGDKKYSVSEPKVGFIYLCRAQTDEGIGGAQKDGTWIKQDTETWVPKEKVSVEGTVSWKNATFKNIISGVKRILKGNDLPLNQTTGEFPIDRNSEAGKIDGNPNSIKVQNITYTLPVSPVYSSTPHCMGGEVGVMLNGVSLFNGFDALLRDAQAHEVQDTCSGHPQVSGQYHYHGLSNCFKDTSVQTVLGYALDGFPLTGPKVAKDKYLQTDDLDECHGLTSEIIIDGKKKVMYHYVMTTDFPYSVSCFHGTPSTTGPSVPMGGGQNGGKQTGVGAESQPGSGSQMRTPPQDAINACSGKTENAPCSMTTPDGTMSGNCHTTPDQKYFACVPNRL